MRLAAHQPDLFPYSGFWHKMYKADMFDVAIWDQLQRPGFQTRVKMMGSWVTLPVLDRRMGQSIAETRIDPAMWRRLLTDAIVGKYRDARYWKARSDEVLSWIDLIQSEWLWQANLSLIVAVRDALAIRTPLGIGMALPHGTGGLVDLCRQYGADTYLSGPGGRKYMDLSMLADAGVDVEFSAHVAPVEDSILSILFAVGNPMLAVMT